MLEDSLCEIHDRLSHHQLTSDHYKTQLITRVREQQEISIKHGKLLLLQQSIDLLKKTCEEERQRLTRVQGEVEALRKSNAKREERLGRAKGRDFTSKISTAQKQNTQRSSLLLQKTNELVSLRKELVLRTVQCVYPQCLQQQDLFELDHHHSTHPSSGMGDTPDDEDWVVSGVSEPAFSSTHYSHISYGYIPTDGSMAEYTSIAKERKKEKSDLEEQCDSGALLCPLSDLYLAVPAAMTFITHCVVLLGNLLDQPLPHPITLSRALSEYGRTDRRVKSVLNSLTKLHNNVMFLCFTQNVPVEKLRTGFILGNLYELLNHSELGREGPFTCHPHLLQQPLTSPPSPQLHVSSTVDWDSSPPLLHSTDTTGPAQVDGSDSDDDDLLDKSLLTEDDVSEEWEEVQDTRLAVGLGGRLEYGLSYSDYRNPQNPSSLTSQPGVQSSVGLFEALGSLLGSGFRN